MSDNPELDLYADAHNIKRAPRASATLDIDKAGKTPSPVVLEAKSVVTPVPGFKNKPAERSKYIQSSLTGYFRGNSTSPTTPIESPQNKRRKVMSTPVNEDDCPKLGKPKPIVADYDDNETNKDELASFKKTLDIQKRSSIRHYLSPSGKPQVCRSPKPDLGNRDRSKECHNLSNPFDSLKGMQKETTLKTKKIKAPDSNKKVEKETIRAPTLTPRSASRNIPEYIGLQKLVSNNVSEGSDDEPAGMGEEEAETEKGTSGAKSVKDDIPADFETVNTDSEYEVVEEMKDIAIEAESNESDFDACMGETGADTSQNDGKGGWVRDDDDCIVRDDDDCIVRDDDECEVIKQLEAGELEDDQDVFDSVNYVDTNPMMDMSPVKQMGEFHIHKDPLESPANMEVDVLESSFSMSSVSLDFTLSPSTKHNNSLVNNNDDDVASTSKLPTRSPGFSDGRRRTLLQHPRDSNENPLDFEITGVPFITDEGYENEPNSERFDKIMATTIAGEFSIFPSLNSHDTHEDLDYILCKTSRRGECSPVPEQIQEQNLEFGNNAFIRLPHARVSSRNGVKYDRFPAYKNTMLKFMETQCQLTLDHVKELFLTLNDKCFDFPGLRKYYGVKVMRYKDRDPERYMHECDRFDKAFRTIAHFVVQTENLLTKEIPFLDKGVRSVTLSLDQCSCLLAHAFLGTMPGRNACNRNNLQTFTFKNFWMNSDDLYVEKLDFIMNYFAKIAEQGLSRKGCVTFYRRTLDEEDIPNWTKSNAKLMPITFLTDGRIEDKKNTLHVDFANEYIGGGVLSIGAVQEEIRFLCCPDMIVSLLLASRMDDNEAILIIGAPTVSCYKGYARSLQFDPMTLPDEQLEFDRFGRLETETVAMDALQFRDPEGQYRKNNLDRELLKAYVGFYSPFKDNEQPKPVSTGNWGCGVFRGDIYYKSFIQWMAASVNKRAVIYHGFGEADIMKKLDCMSMLAFRFNLTVRHLYDILLTYRTAKIQHPINFFYVWYVKYIRHREQELKHIAKL